MVPSHFKYLNLCTEILLQWLINKRLKSVKLYTVLAQTKERRIRLVIIEEKGSI